ncbi:MAG: MazG nucleotide pyrophosphohydrolase domain-containing protein [Nanoarchaeota archaeon]
MELKQLLDFIAMEDDRLKVQYGHPDETKKILARTVKITEELGELSNEILAFHSMQRKEKMDNHTKETLHEEVADVLITTLLLAKTLNMDIEKVLEAKIEKINKRHEE